MNKAKCNISDIVSFPIFEISGKGKSRDTRVSDYWLGLVMRIEKEHKGSFWNEEIILK